MYVYYLSGCENILYKSDPPLRQNQPHQTWTELERNPSIQRIRAQIFPHEIPGTLALFHEFSDGAEAS